MAYSNITPPTLPEYDSALHPHYVLEFEYENGSENWFAVSLRYSSTPFTYDGAAVTNAGEHHLQTYGTGTGEWTYWGILTEMSIAPGTTSTGGYRRIWTNHNILDGSGKVWLAANTATPAEANLDRLSIMKSKLVGLIMAWCAPVRQFHQREPVAFLYGHVAKEGETPTHTINGVGYVGIVAPDIYKVYTPELQKTHPYAYLSFVFLGKHVLMAWPKEPVVQDDPEENIDGYGYPEGYDGSNERPICFNLSYDGTMWEEPWSGSYANRIAPLWGNTDLYTTDGNLYLPAIDRIPIYEQEE